MKTIYKSKIDFGLVLIIVLIMGLSALPMFIGSVSWFGLFVLSGVTIFIIYVFAATFYEIEDNTLYIRSGWSKPIEIDISTIVKIQETNNILSAPATSLDRLEIEYDKRKKIMISPKMKKDFLSKIKELNPQVIINLKKP
jgi:hypothetical protein